MKPIIVLLLVMLSFSSFCQTEKMSNEKLDVIFNDITEEIVGQNGNWQFVIEDQLFICITDQNANRMRIISPIIEVKDMNGAQMLACMEANFHTVLDSKYAISEDLLWAVFIHPLEELSEDQVKSAVYQVYSTVVSFGTNYSSGLFSFPKSNEPPEEENQDETEKSGTKS